MASTASNPLILQGTLNRIMGSITFASNADLNVTAPYLGPEGITLTLQGEATEYIDTMTGGVTSPNVYQRANCMVNLLRTQSLAALYKSTMEAYSLVGSFIVYPDTSTLGQYQIVNGALMSLEPLKINGRDAGWMITLTGYYNINSQLWNATSGANA